MNSNTKAQFMSMENGPTLKIMELARQDLPEYSKVPIWTKFDDNLYDKETEEEKETIKELDKKTMRKMLKNTDIKSTKEMTIEFNSLLPRIYALHPELDFENWPTPRGKNPHKPTSNFLRDDLLRSLRDPCGLLDYWRYLIVTGKNHKKNHASVKMLRYFILIFCLRFLLIYHVSSGLCVGYK